MNTSSVAPGVVGGKLLENGCSVIKANVRETAASSGDRSAVTDRRA